MTDIFRARMELGRSDRRRLLRWMRPGVILEIGSGTGELMKMVAEQFPDSELFGIERDHLRMTSAKELVPDACFIEADILNSPLPEILRGRCNSVLMNAAFHELEIQAGEHGIQKILGLVRELLAPTGIFVFRDGVKPNELADTRRILLKSEYARLKFGKFFDEYRHRRIQWNRDATNSDIILLSSYDLHDILTKYFLEGDLWENDMDETFGTKSVLAYERCFSDFFALVHIESYLAPYLEEVWRNDIEILESTFPDSHIIMIGVAL